MFVCDGLQNGRIRQREENRKDYLIVRSGISKAETTNKDCARRFVLKLYRHEASRGLFATAELLVNESCTKIVL